MQILFWPDLQQMIPNYPIRNFILCRIPGNHSLSSQKGEDWWNRFNYHIQFIVYPQLWDTESSSQCKNNIEELGKNLNKLSNKNHLLSFMGKIQPALFFPFPSEWLKNELTEISKYMVTKLIIFQVPQVRQR